MSHLAPHTTVHGFTAGKAFMHVNNDIYGVIDLWTSCYGNYTAVYRSGSQEVHFVQAADEECLNEWLAQNPSYELLMVIEPVRI